MVNKKVQGFLLKTKVWQFVVKFRTLQKTETAVFNCIFSFLLNLFILWQFMFPNSDFCQKLFFRTEFGPIWGHLTKSFDLSDIPSEKNNFWQKSELGNIKCHNMNKLTKNENIQLKPAVSVFRRVLNLTKYCHTP